MMVLFICTGNTCRSPMAAALMRRALDKRGRGDIMVESAGISASGEPTSPNAIAAIAELGGNYALSLATHCSRSVTPELLQSADRIAVMSAQHAAAIIARGADSGRILVLSADGMTGIADPYGGDMDTYRHTRDQLEKAVEALADEIDA